MRPALRAVFPRSHIQTPCRGRHISFPRLGEHPQQKRYASQSNSAQPEPTDGFYEDLLNAPLHSVQPGTRTAPTPPPPEELPKTEKEETLAKARVVFGSRLAGPVERQQQLYHLSQNIAGVLVPPRPEEPDNCCMSGCVNCVWDQYRDELEEWAAKNAEAKAKKMEASARDQAASSMDDDGGGSEANWESAPAGEDLFEGVPVGIREFMRTEKKLKLRHQQEDSEGG
ncbi:hypothetical protein MBLNU230_g4231t1 [Neophaeotheca triangularis]